MGIGLVAGYYLSEYEGEPKGGGIVAVLGILIALII